MTNKIPSSLNESIEDLLNELKAKCIDTEDKGDKFILASKYNSVKYLYQLYKNTYKAINELKNQNDL
jgi:hypothetical protein